MIQATAKHTFALVFLFIVLLGVAGAACTEVAPRSPVHPDAGNTASPTSAARTCAGMSIAAYFPPGAWWDWMAASYPATRFIIANNDAGPGSTRETTLLNGIRQMKQAGIRV